MGGNDFLGILTLEDLAEPRKTYAKAIGIDNLYRLCEVAGGGRIYLPKPDGLFQNLIRRLLIEDYRSGGHTIETLAIKYSVCEKTVLTYLHST